MNDHPDAKLTLREAFEKHYDKDELVEATLRRFDEALRKWERFTNNPTIGRTADKTVAQFRQECLDRGYSPATIRSNWSMLRSIFRKVGPRETRNPGALNIIKAVPWMKPVKFVRKLPRRVNLDLISKLYVACRYARFPRTDVPAPDLWRALIVTCFCTGLRKDDLLTLKPEQIDLENGTADVLAGKTRKQDLFPLHSVVVEHLKRIWNPYADRVFRGVLRRGGRFYVQWDDLMEAAGIPEEDRFSIHDLRRTGGSEVDRVDRGLGKVFLQHAPRSVTDVSYINATEDLKDVIEQMRLPDGFRAGPKMRDRAEHKRRQERARIHADEFFVPVGSVPEHWKFQPGKFWYRGRWYRLPGRMRRQVLENLAHSSEPVTVEELAQVVCRSKRNPNPESRTVQKRVQVEVSHVRCLLRRAFGLTDQWDPVPCCEIGGGGAWTLHIPPLEGPDHWKVTPERLKAARVAIRLTKGQLAEMVGVNMQTIKKWESEQRAIPLQRQRELQHMLWPYLNDGWHGPSTKWPTLNGEQIYEARLRAEMRQADVAQQLGVNRHTVCDWENDKTRPNRRMMDRLLEILGPYLDRQEDAA